jgi:hypothetical protein
MQRQKKHNQGLMDIYSDKLAYLIFLNANQQAADGMICFLF